MYILFNLPDVRGQHCMMKWYVYICVSCLAVPVYSFRVISSWKVSETSCRPVHGMVCLIEASAELLVFPTDVAFSLRAQPVYAFLVVRE